jgi:hypothetical protein
MYRMKELWDSTKNNTQTNIILARLYTMGNLVQVQVQVQVPSMGVFPHQPKHFPFLLDSVTRSTEHKQRDLTCILEGLDFADDVS